MMLSDIYVEAKNAVNAVQRKDYDALGRSYTVIYNYFVHYPGGLIGAEHPYLLGTAFYYFTKFRETDPDIAEVKLENTLYLLGTCIRKSSNEVEKIASAIRCFMLLTAQPQYASKLFTKVQNRYQHFNSKEISGNPILVRAETLAYMDMVAAYLFAFSLEKDLHVYIDSDEMQLFADCVNVFRKRVFNEEALKKGETLFETMYGILQGDIIRFGHMKALNVF